MKLLGDIHSGTRRKILDIGGNRDHSAAEGGVFRVVGAASLAEVCALSVFIFSSFYWHFTSKSPFWSANLCCFYSSTTEVDPFLWVWWFCLLLVSNWSLVVLVSLACLYFSQHMAYPEVELSSTRFWDLIRSFGGINVWLSPLVSFPAFLKTVWRSQ